MRVVVRSNRQSYRNSVTTSPTFLFFLYSLDLLLPGDFNPFRSVECRRHYAFVFENVEQIEAVQLQWRSNGRRLTW